MEHIRQNFNNANQVNLFPVTDRDQPVDEALNKITDIMLADDLFDQRRLFGNDRSKYHFTFCDKIGGNQHRAFYLQDFLFAHNKLDDAQDHDSFMRMIDRDRLGQAMRDVLVYDFGLPDTAHQSYELDPIPCFWRRTMRNISHPAYKAHFPSPSNVVPLFKAA